MAEVKQYIFFDFEMLCSNRGMPFNEMEGIRLGAVKYNLETESVTYFDRYIRPKSRKPLSRFCKQLTGISDLDLVDADDFKTVLEQFLTWIGGIKKSRFFSWSPSDLLRLKYDAEIHDIANATINKIEKRYVDFQAIFTKRVTKNNFSVENALQIYGLAFVGEKHNPMYDAYNTLRIYLSFLNQPIKSDLAMVKQFIFENEVPEIEAMNAEIHAQFKHDLEVFLSEFREMYKMKDAFKIIKRTRKIVQKYENVLINRSRIFSKELMMKVSLLQEFYHEILLSYDEHFHYSSKIMILDETIVKPIQQITLKRG